MVGVSDDGDVRERLERLNKQIEREEQIKQKSQDIRLHYNLPSSLNAVRESLGETERRLSFLQEQRDQLMRHGDLAVAGVGKEDEMAYWVAGAAHTWERINYKIGLLNYQLEQQEKTISGANRLESIGFTQAKDKAFEAAQKVPLLKRALERYQSLTLLEDPKALLVESPPPAPSSPSSTALDGVLRVKIYLIDLPHHDSGNPLRIGLSVDDRWAPVWHKFKPNRPSPAEEWQLEMRGARTLEILVKDDQETEGGVMFALAYLPLTSIFRTQQQQQETQPLLFQVALEPEGQLQVHMEWIKLGPAAPTHQAGGVHRQPRAEKSKIYLVMGHRFKHTRFFQVARCALCHDLLFRGAGYRCTGKKAISLCRVQVPGS